MATLPALVLPLNLPPWASPKTEKKPLRNNMSGTAKARAGMNSLGIRFAKLKRKMQTMKKSDVEIANIIARLTGESEDGSQSTMTSFFSGK